MSTLFGTYRFLEKLFADGGYQGAKFRSGVANVLPALEIEIVRRPAHGESFMVLPRRWIVETNHRLAEPLSQVGQGLGGPES
jgi:CelD/BcsL family acetyltransferase involved in cellulose biosynthesis